MQTSAHTQTINPRSLDIQRQRPALDIFAAVLIGVGLAAGLVWGWAA